jgi:transcriptional regulator with XRE-family HTH domain
MSDLAQRIRVAREKLGVSIEEAERATKIRRRYIEAIEAGDFDRLPDGPPSRGFIKNYARYLGLDPDQSLNDFEAEVGVPITQVNEVVPPPPARQPAVSRYTQLIKLPQIRWKGELPPEERTELNMMADAGDDKPQDGERHNTSLGRLVFRRTETPAMPNSFSLREPKVSHTGDVRPFQLGRSPFSLRNLTGSLSNEATLEPRRMSPMSMNSTGGTSPLALIALAAGGLVLLVALFGLIILPALRGSADQTAGTAATPAINVAILGTPQPGLALGSVITQGAAITAADSTALAIAATVPVTEVAALLTATVPAANATPQPTGQGVQLLTGGGVQLVLDAHEHAWVRVFVDGNVAYQGIPQIGPNSSWHGQNTVGIETGNAGAFDVIINNVRIGRPGNHNATIKVMWDTAGKVTSN